MSGVLGVHFLFGCELTACFCYISPNEEKKHCLSSAGASVCWEEEQSSTSDRIMEQALTRLCQNWLPLLNGTIEPSVSRIFTDGKWLWNSFSHVSLTFSGVSVVFLRVATMNWQSLGWSLSRLCQTGPIKSLYLKLTSSLVTSCGAFNDLCSFLSPQLHIQSGKIPSWRNGVGKWIMDWTEVWWIWGLLLVGPEETDEGEMCVIICCSSCMFCSSTTIFAEISHWQLWAINFLVGCPKPAVAILKPTIKNR